MINITAENLAKLWHETCEEIGPKQPLPKIILPWEDLDEDQKKMKIAIAASILAKLEKM
jgi:hypothetical protein